MLQHSELLAEILERSALSRLRVTVELLHAPSAAARARAREAAEALVSVWPGLDVKAVASAGPHALAAVWVERCVGGWEHEPAVVWVGECGWGGVRGKEATLRAYPLLSPPIPLRYLFSVSIQVGLSPRPPPLRYRWGTSRRSCILAAPPRGAPMPTVESLLLATRKKMEGEGVLAA